MKPLSEPQILYKNKDLIAVNKPPGWMIHRTSLDPYASNHIQEWASDQMGRPFHAIHRLDRKTSGIVLLGGSAEAVKTYQSLFTARNVEKVYYAIVRGYTRDEETIDYPVTNDRGKTQEAVTVYRTLQKTEIPVPLGKFSTSRYSLIEVKPFTGRMHQIRKHMDHVRNPIIGDRPYGCNKQNKLFLEHFGLSEMLLHARRLRFEDPITNSKVELEAPFFDEFLRIAGLLNLTLGHFS